MCTDHHLIERWRKCNLEGPPYLFPDDQPEIINDKAKTYRDFDEYIAGLDFGASSDRNLHIGLLPIPYVGNLANASIFVLMLNPGFSRGGYFAEQHSPEFKQAHIRNLLQKNADDEYPFIFLDPRFVWHPGFEYWQNKFHTIIEALAEQSGTTYRQAMSKLAKRLSCLELLPYPSKSFNAGALLNILPSVKAMQEFVWEILLPKAKDEKVLIIVTRGVKYWQLPKHKNIILYEGSETRLASLTLNSRGGKAIAKHFGF
jgi:hypothetical protein